MDGSKRVAVANGSNLNPNAQEFRPGAGSVEEDYRCIFVTFSNGYPIEEEQIARFFTMSYGPCVERVYVHQTKPRDRPWPPPLFGKIIFKYSCLPDMVLNGKQKVCFWIDGRPLWCKKFDAGRGAASSSATASRSASGSGSGSLF